MKVILQRDIPKLGKSGDIKDVADGYARNYLFPRQFAVAATGGALKDHNARMAREQERSAKLLSSAQSDAEKLQGCALTIVGKVGSGTKLYGSITAQDIADEIAKVTNVTIDKRRVGLADPIKILGTYNVPVRLHSDVVVNIPVEVLTAEEIERRKNMPVVEETPAEAETGEAADGAEAEAAGEPQE